MQIQNIRRKAWVGKMTMLLKKIDFCSIVLNQLADIMEFVSAIKSEVV